MLEIHHSGKIPRFVSTQLPMKTLKNHICDLYYMEEVTIVLTFVNVTHYHVMVISSTSMHYVHVK